MPTTGSMYISRGRLPAVRSDHRSAREASSLDPPFLLLHLKNPLAPTHSPSPLTSALSSIHTGCLSSRAKKRTRDRSPRLQCFGHPVVQLSGPRTVVSPAGGEVSCVRERGEAGQSIRHKSYYTTHSSYFDCFPPFPCWALLELKEKSRGECVGAKLDYYAGPPPQQ